MPEGEEKEQEIENLLEKIMKETFSNLAKEIDFQGVQETQSPKEIGPKAEHAKTSQLHYPRLKIGENPKNSKRKGDSYLERSSHKTLS